MSELCQSSCAMGRKGGWIAIAIGVTVACCSTPKINTTMLTSTDIVKMTDEMAMDLAASKPIASRNADSPRWVFTLDKVSNRTEHLMDDNEKWGTMARFRALLSQSLLNKDRNITFILPGEEWRRYEAQTFTPDQARLKPTHALRAEFRSDTQQSLLARRDAYLCEFQLLDLNTGDLLWSDSYEVKYAVTKNSFD